MKKQPKMEGKKHKIIGRKKARNNEGKVKEIWRGKTRKIEENGGKPKQNGAK